MFFIPAFPSFATILSLILIVWPRGGGGASGTFPLLGLFFCVGWATTFSGCCDVDMVTCKIYQSSTQSITSQRKKWVVCAHHPHLVQRSRNLDTHTF